MNENLKKYMEKMKNPKALIIIGGIGVFLILISSFLPQKDTKTPDSGKVFNVEEYRKTLEKSVSSVVYGITGDKKATVVITLQNGIKYSYADDTKTDTDVADGEKSKQTRKSSQSSHITVRDSSGDEKALVVTENMPEIRGVAVICDNGDDDYIKEKIKSAVMAALDVTSKRVYITGRN